MHPIIYDVAVSIDGYIAGPGGDISRFAFEGPVVEDYTDRMAQYAVAVMGRATYEFGYRFGMEPGQNPYPHMRTVVFSKTLTLPPDSAVTVLRHGAAQALHDLRSGAGGPVYLCGGGALAGALLSAGLIDLIRLKRAPVLLGGGVRLSGDCTTAPPFARIATKRYPDGYVFQELRP